MHTFFPFPLDMVASSYAAKMGKLNTGAFHVQPENITSSLGCGKVQWVQNMIYRLFHNTHYYKYRHIHVPSAFMGRMLEERDYNVIANSELSATPQFALDNRSLFLPGNPKDLARAIDYWLDNPKERECMEKTYVKAAKKYSLAISVRMFEEMLNEEIEEQKCNNRF